MFFSWEGHYQVLDKLALLNKTVCLVFLIKLGQNCKNKLMIKKSLNFQRVIFIN